MVVGEEGGKLGKGERVKSGDGIRGGGDKGCDAIE